MHARVKIKQLKTQNRACFYIFFSWVQTNPGLQVVSAIRANHNFPACLNNCVFIIYTEALKFTIDRCLLFS